MSKHRKLRGSFGGGGDEPPSPFLHPGIGAIVESLARDAAERDFKALQHVSKKGNIPTNDETHR
jgi:hypothetical protein